MADQQSYLPSATQVLATKAKSDSELVQKSENHNQQNFLRKKVKRQATGQISLRIKNSKRLAEN